MKHFNTIVHQTLDNKENIDDIENNGPFPALNITNTYLGQGYYFWDDHIKLAHWWGKQHCNNDYLICEGNLQVEKEFFFDIVGCRQDQIHLLNLINKLGVEKMVLGKVIELLKGLNALPYKKGIFPYKVIRAVEVNENSFDEKHIKFSTRTNDVTSLTPKIIICLIEKNKLILSAYRVIYPEN